MANISGGKIDRVIYSDGRYNNKDGQLNERNSYLSESFKGRKTTNPVLGGKSFVIVMQATDSITANVYSWQVLEPDFAGKYYPGPNSPTKIAMRMVSLGY